MFILASNYSGYNEGANKIQKEAVRLGYANFVVDENDNLIFKWKEK